MNLKLLERKTSLVVFAILGGAAFSFQSCNTTSEKKVNSVSIEESKEVQKSNDIPVSGNRLKDVRPIIGSVAQDFVLEDQNGIFVSLENMEASRILLVFSSALCETCSEFYPHINQFVASHPPVDVLVIQLEASVSENKRLLETNNYNFTMLDGGAAVFAAYNVLTTPTSLLIDSNSLKILKAESLHTVDELVQFVK